MIQTCVIEHNGGPGISAVNRSTAAKIEGCTLSNNGDYALRLYADTLKNLSNLTIQNHAANAIYVLSDTVYTGKWKNHGVPYVIAGDVDIDDGDTLTLEAGVQLKFQPERWLRVYGALKAVGTETSHIDFTSFQGDPVGGDTNQDGGSTLPMPGDWSYLRYAILCSGYQRHART